MESLRSPRWGEGQWEGEKKKKKRTFGVSSQSRLKEKYKDIYLLPLGEEKSPSSLLVPRRKETAGGRGWEEVGGKEISGSSCPDNLRGREYAFR